MEETAAAIIGKVTETYPTATQIFSGHKVTVFYDCVQLSTGDLARLAAEAIGDLGDDAFDLSLGLAYSGILFSSAVAGGRQVAILQKDGQVCGPSLKGKRVIVVDDVVHSGSNMRRGIAAAKQFGAEVVGCACIVDRSNGAADLGKITLYSAYQDPLR